MENNAGITYKYYFSQRVTVDITSGSVVVTSPLPFTGVLRVAVLKSSMADAIALQPLLNVDVATLAAVEQVYDANSGEYGSQQRALLLAREHAPAGVTQPTASLPCCVSACGRCTRYRSCCAPAPSPLAYRHLPGRRERQVWLPDSRPERHGV